MSPLVTVWTEEQKQHQSKIMSGVENPMYGRKNELSSMFKRRHQDFMTEEEITLWKKHTSENHADVSCKNNPMFGENIKDHMTLEAYEQHNKNISIANRNVPKSEEHKINISIFSKESFENERVAWNKGLTKASDPRVLKNCVKPPWNKGKIKESDKTIAEQSKITRVIWFHKFVTKLKTQVLDWT